MVFVIICIVPYGLLIVESGMDLHWAIYALQVMTSPFLPPVVLAVTWAKATGPAVITGTLCEPRREKTVCFAYAKTKTQIRFAVTAKLISAFVFATRILQSLFFLNTKFQASSHLL